MGEDEELLQYKDISDLKKELEGLKGKNDVSPNELHDAVQKLAQTIIGMLEVFGAASEQMRLEDKEHDSDIKRHEMIIAKLDKLIEQNKTIAEGMVAVVEMVKEKFSTPVKENEGVFNPRAEPRLFPKPQPIMAPMTQTPPMPTLAYPPNFGMQMPPMQPAPPPDLDFPDEPFQLDEESKKKGLFGMFKK